MQQAFRIRHLTDSAPSTTRIGSAVSDAWHSAQVREFEHVKAGRSISLLRVTAKAPRRRTPEQRPTLVADDGHNVVRFAALPSPPDNRGMLRSAYSVPAELVTPDTVFSLELDDGFVISLPAPSSGAARIVPDEPEESDAQAAEETPAAEAEFTPIRAEDDRRDDVLPKLAELSAALAEAERARAQAEHALAEAEEHIRAASEADQATSDSRLQAESERADGAVLEAAAAREEAESLRQELASEHALREQGERELHDALVSSRQLSFEREELTRQAEGFDQVATNARERATQAEAEKEQSAAALQELETWREELERRLADAATELGAAQTRLVEDEQELTRLREALAEAQASADTAHAQAADSEAKALGRVRELEAERAQIARVAAELTTLLDAADGPVTGAEPPAAADDPMMLEELSRRAEARVAEEAALELEHELRSPP
jgi:hypothetical protein